MIVTINENYRVSVENYRNNVLQKLVRDEAGQPKTRGSKNGGTEYVFKNLGYYPTLSSAMNAYVHLSLEDDFSVLTVPEYLRELSNREDSIEALLETVD